MMNSPFGTPQVGGNGAFGVPGILAGLLAAIGNLPAQNQQRQSAKADLAYKQAETKAIGAQSDPNSPQNRQLALRNQLTQQQIDQGATAFQQQQQQVAQQTYTSLGQRVMTNPAWAQNPAVKAQFAALEKTDPTLVSPYNADGTFNEDAFLKPLSSLPPDANGEKVREFILAQPPGSARVNAARSAGIKLTDAEASAQSSFTAKAQNDITRSAQMGVHYANADRTAASRATALSVMQNAEAHRFDGEAVLDKQKAEEYRTVVAAQTTRANAAMVDAQARLTSAQASVTRAGQAMRSNQGLAARFYQSAFGDADRAAHSLETFDEAYSTAQANGADDATLAQIAAKRNAAQATLDQARSQLNLLQQELGANAGYGAQVSGASGGVKTTVTNAGSSPKPPAGAVHGKKGGIPGWQYPDGSWHADP